MKYILFIAIAFLLSCSSNNNESNESQSIEVNPPHYQDSVVDNNSVMNTGDENYSSDTDESSPTDDSRSTNSTPTIEDRPKAKAEPYPEEAIAKPYQDAKAEPYHGDTL